jgi:signal transduction histidine kinase/ActR/RegA family two-component response regulator
MLLENDSHLPFALDAVQPTFDRASRLAKRLFGVPNASVVVLQDGRGWSSQNRGPITSSSDDAGQFVLRSGEPLWVEDVRQDQRFRGHPAAQGPMGVKFYAGAPISLADGLVVGVLCAYGPEPKAFDAELAALLTDLAAGAAEECDRTRLAETAAKSKIELETAQAMFQALLQAAPSALVMFDRDMRVLAATDLWLQGYDKPEHEIIGQSFYDLDPSAPDYRAGFDRVLAGQSIKFKPMTGRGDRWLQGGCTPWRNAAGEIGGVTIAHLDVTELMKVQEALAHARDQAESANRAKSAFLATMSHEIRTPLNGVLGMTQALIAGAPDPTQREQLKVIQQSGETLLAILNDVLDLSKIEAGKLELEEIEFDLGDIVGGVEASFAGQANRRGLGFSMAAEAAGGVYRGDPTRLSQILYNLISNAVKFTEDGEIRVRAWRCEGQVCFEVADTGLGMSPDVVAGLFEKFSQADASTTRRFGGTGLGLAISRRLAELMGGAIEVKSIEGQGSTFTLTVPLLRLGESRIRGESSPAASPAPEPEALKLRVLAAEDNAVNQLVLRTLLNQIGVDPMMVANGVQAVEAWEAQPFDLVLMDVQMPEMDGVTATRLIRRKEAAAGRPRTPIIALTANAMSHQIDEYLAAGIDGCVVKPIQARALFEACEAAVRLAEEGLAAPSRSTA